MRKLLPLTLAASIVAPSALVALVLAAPMSTAGAAPARDAPLGIGRVPASTELANRMISVAPDGTGLPAGRGSAREGRSIYNTQCGACHGMRGEGIGEYPALVGGRESLKT